MGDTPSTNLSSMAQRLVEELRPHTPFAEAIVRRQAQRAGVAVQTLSESDLHKVVPLIVAAATGFVDPGVLSRLRRLIGGK